MAVPYNQETAASQQSPDISVRSKRFPHFGSERSRLRISTNGRSFYFFVRWSNAALFCIPNQSNLFSDVVMASGNRKTVGPSPYTFRDIDAAISHLETVLDSGGARSLFSPTYWRERILQASTTKGLNPKQQQRLHRLLERISAS